MISKLKKKIHFEVLTLVLCGSQGDIYAKLVSIYILFQFR